MYWYNLLCGERLFEKHKSPGQHIFTIESYPKPEESRNWIVKIL
jgi:hypothetical protein